MADFDAGHTITFADDLAVYEQGDLASYDLIVQCWSMGSLTPSQEAALVAAVRAGTGFAGWHGGVIGTCVGNAAYLRMVGGRFLWHPDGPRRYRVSIVPQQAAHPIVAGLSDFEVDTEQYWLLSDAANTTLATCTFQPEPTMPWDRPTDMPVAWTRQWGEGRVFVCTLGHDTADLAVPPVRTMIHRGLAWAARP